MKFLKKGKDLSDWIESSGKYDELVELMINATYSVNNLDDQKDQQNGSFLRLISAPELLEMIIPENKFLLDPILKEQSLTMIYAARGTGKTMFSLNLANAVATGTDF